MSGEYGTHRPLEGTDADVFRVLMEWIHSESGGWEREAARHWAVVHLLEDPDRCRRIGYGIHRGGPPGAKGEPGVPE